MNAYEKLTPEQITDILAKTPIAYCPWGAIEWHGSHLPLGVDGLLASKFCEELADRFGGVVLPCMYLPISTLTHAHSITFPADCVVAAARQTVQSLRRIGCKAICIVTGHYAQGHLIELYRLALQEMESDPTTLVLATTPLDLLNDPDLLDHAGNSETSQMLHYYKELVRLDKYQPSNKIRESAVIGNDPSEANAEQAQIWLNDAATGWGAILTTWLKTPNPEQIKAFYINRLASLKEYEDKYFKGSWDEALQRWLDDKEAHAS